jgi:hypothetical protein
VNMSYYCIEKKETVKKKTFECKQKQQAA